MFILEVCIKVSSPNVVFNSEGTQNIEVNLFNYGITTLTSATIKWKVNDGTVNTYNWTGSLAQATVAEAVNIGSFDFSGENFFTIEIWTELPNGNSDENTNNDLLASKHTINQYCTSNIVYDEWTWFNDVVIGNIIHLNCNKAEHYNVTDYSTYFQENYASGSNLNYDCFVGNAGYVAFWIDLNDDNDFEDADEYLGTSAHFAYNENLTGTITIPETAPEGMHKLRIRFIAGNTAPAQGDACTPLSTFSYEGDCHQYAINVYNPNTPPPCASNPIPANSSVDVVLNEILEWSSTDATNFDVYFGTTATPIFVQNQAENSYNPGLLDQNTQYYWKIIAKNDFGNATGCEIWSFTTGEDSEYCIPRASDCEEWGDHIDDFYMLDLIHENTGCAGMSGYGDYTETEFTTDLIQGSNVTWASNYSTSDALAIWIDFNDDGIFYETNEFVYHTEVEFVNEHIDTDNFNLPQDAPFGTHRMRVRCGYYGHLLPDYEFSGDQACASIGYSETHDYNITIIDATEAPQCAENPNPENGAVNQYLNPELTWSANQALSYDVYFGTTTLEYIGEVTNASYSPEILDADTEYQWKIVPKNSIGEATGCDIWTFTTGENLNYCTDYLYVGDAYGSPCSWGDEITDFSVSNLEMLDFVCGETNGVNDYTYLTGDFEQGANYTWNATIGLANVNHIAIWLDVNNNGVFAEDELVYNSTEHFPAYECSGNMIIPANTPLGEHRFRVRLKNGEAFEAGDACTVFTYGQAYDFTANITETTTAPECAVNPIPADNATEQQLNLLPLGWNCNYATEYDVYFGTTSTPPLVSAGQPLPT